MLISPAYAQAAGAQSASSPGGMLFFFGQFILIGLIFWFLLIRPQQQRAKAHRAMIDAVKKGDSVVTSGGLIGKVTKVEDDKVEVEIATGVKVKVIKATLADITPLGSGKPAND
jgi:preprotein translocase subunit YajC